MNRNYQLSVLLPFYRPGAFFTEALDSVLSQECSNFELVLINNNADARSVKTADQYVTKYSNVRLLHESVQGIAYALNNGLRNCTSGYVARMDADDICLPGRLQSQMNFLESNCEVDAVTGRVNYLCEQQINEGMKLYVDYINTLVTEDDLFNFRFVDTPFAHPSIMFRYSLIERFGFYSTENVPEDFELWLRWFSNEVRIIKLPEAVISWRDHQNRLSRVSESYHAAAFNQVRIKYLASHIKKVNKPFKPVYIWGTGKLAKQKVKLLKAHDIVPEGFIDVKNRISVNGEKELHYLNLPRPGTIFIVSLVSNRGKHREIFDFLTAAGYHPEKDFLIGS